MRRVVVFSWQRSVSHMQNEFEEERIPRSHLRGHVCGERGGHPQKAPERVRIVNLKLNQ